MENYRLPMPSGHSPERDGVHALIRLRRLLLPLALPFVLFACSGGDGGTQPQEPGAPAVVEVWQGDAQAAQVTRELSSALVARVADADGLPVPDVTVSWSVDAGGGIVEAEASATDGSGRVRARWTLGERSGSVEAVASVPGAGEATFTATALPGPPEQITLLSGDGQQAVRGGPFPEPIVVELRDAYGNGVDNRTLAVNDDGDGWAADPSPRTDADGRAEIQWYAGAGGPSTQTLVVSTGELAAEVEGQVIEPEPGTSYWGRREWVEYIPGTLPLVITAPHGGTQEPDDIPDRTSGATVRDMETDDMARRLGDALEERVGARPHLIILHLHRKKLDANRDIGEAAQGDRLAERTWREFQHWAETAKAIVQEGFGRGFYMDLHGHGKHQDFELGYLLNRNDLELDDELLDAPWAVAKSSLRTLAESSSLSFPELVRGESSLGALYEAEGYTSIPGPERPHPTGPFFAGGYNTQRHACRDGGTICGYQLELNWQDVRSSASSRQAFAEAHARVMEEFFRIHLGRPLKE